MPRRSPLKIFGSILVTLLVGLGLILIFLGHKADFLAELQTRANIISPILPDVKAEIAGNIWLPQSSILGTQNIDLSAQSAFFIEANSGNVLFAKNAHDKVKIASLTKIMTAIVALENKSWDTQMVVSNQAANVQPDKMDLGAGEKLTLKELLSGMFLISANDAAETVAENTFNDRAKFVQQMNDQALSIGMLETKFTNPTGLDSDDPDGLNLGTQQYSSAYDVALMARFLVNKYPQILDLTSQTEIDLPATDSHQAYYMPTSISLVQTYPGVMGLKTGYTDEAGYTLVTVAKKNGVEIIGVVLGAEQSRDDMKKVLDYCYQQLGLAPKSASPSATPPGHKSK